MSGRSPSGRATRASTEPQEGLGHTASVPNADDRILWCVHTIGPDDVNAAPDFDTAERWAASTNRQIREYTKASGMESDPYWPETRAVVAVWPWSAEEHAADITHSIREFTPIVIAKAEDLEARAREIEGDSDNPLRVAEANKLLGEAADLRAQYASAIEARSDATGTGAAEGESAAPSGETPQ